MDSRQRYNYIAILFCHSRHLAGVSEFRIDNHTIKRGKIFSCNSYLVPISVGLICICFALSDVVRC